MSWVSDYKYTWLQSLALNIIKSGGNVPYHIAFIMDGNRRYANSVHIQKIEGHSKGFDKLADCLRWCLDMGIREVTTFAFSIENFKRSESEVNGLFDLMREKLSKLLQEGPKLSEHGVRIRVVGNLHMIPEDLQKLIARTMLETEKNDKLFLNVAFAYTSRDEITQAAEAVLVHGDLLHEEDISERLLDECMYSRQSPSPDLLFRSSGETRISDFLMWQLDTTVMYFTKLFWPQITIWTFLGGILSFQRVYQHMKFFKKIVSLERVAIEKRSNFNSLRVQEFLHGLDTYRKGILTKLWTSGQ